MNIPEASKILKDYIGTGPEAEPVEFDKACKLGAEALEFLERWRAKAEIQPFPLLPSETTD